MDYGTGRARLGETAARCECEGRLGSRQLQVVGVGLTQSAVKDGLGAGGVGANRAAVARPGCEQQMLFAEARQEGRMKYRPRRVKLGEGDDSVFQRQLQVVGVGCQTSSRQVQ